MMTEPDPSYHGLAYFPALGHGAYIIKARVQLLRDLGPAISPFNAFLTIQGLETLSLRMERHWQNAQQVAEFLDGHAAGRPRSTIAGLPSSPWHDRATKYFEGRGYGSVLAFEIEGGRDAGKKFADSLRAAPPCRQHRRRAFARDPSGVDHPLPADRRGAAGRGGVTGLVRLSVGLESIEDILADLEIGFAAAK